MTNTRLNGVYFTETSGNTTEYTQDQVPLFIVQTSTAIATIDAKLTHYTSFSAFETIATNKGLAKTLAYMEQILLEYNSTEFYVYSVKTDTATTFSDLIKETAHLTDITSVIYVEETKSANANTISDKITAIKNGVVDNATYGTFRIAYVIPYGTVSDAVTNKASGVTSESAVITSLTSILTGTGNGRMCVALPDENAGIVVGKCLATPYNVDPGFTGVNSNVTASSYVFNNTEMISLQNLGVLFLRKETVQGVLLYRIEAGVTTSFKESSNDGLILCRKIVDEVLRNVKWEAEGLVKDNETSDNVNNLQGATNFVINKFVSEGSVIRDGTSLSASAAGDMGFRITGGVKPVRSIQTIDVDTVIN